MSDKTKEARKITNQDKLDIIWNILGEQHHEKIQAAMSAANLTPADEAKNADNRPGYRRGEGGSA